MSEEPVLTDEELSALSDAVSVEAGLEAFSDLTQPTPVQNKKMQALIERFVSQYQKKLTSFLRTKINVNFLSLSSVTLDAYEKQSKNQAFSSFTISNRQEPGIVAYDLLFLHTVINLLFGGQVGADEPVMKGFGKSAHKIAETLSLMSIESFTEALHEQFDIETTLSKTSTHLSLVLNRPLKDTFYTLQVEIAFEGLSTALHFLLPCTLLDDLFLENDTRELHPETRPSKDFSRVLEEELVEQSLHLRVLIPNLEVGLKEVMNLKSGDLLPIADATRVVLALKDKALFNAMIGKVEDKRAVKITERLLYEE